MNSRKWSRALLFSRRALLPQYKRPQKKSACIAIATSALRKKGRDACAAYIRVSQCGTCNDAHSYRITPSYNYMAIYTCVGRAKFIHAYASVTGWLTLAGYKFMATSRSFSL